MKVACSRLSRSVGTIKKRGGQRAGSGTSKETTGAANKASCLKGLKVLSFNIFSRSPFWQQDQIWATRSRPKSTLKTYRSGEVFLLYKVTSIKSQRSFTEDSPNFSSVKHHPIHLISAFSVKNYSMKVNDEVKKGFLFNSSVKYTLWVHYLCQFYGQGKWILKGSVWFSPRNLAVFSSWSTKGQDWNSGFALAL